MVFSLVVIGHACTETGEPAAVSFSTVSQLLRSGVVDQPSGKQQKKDFGLWVSGRLRPEHEERPHGDGLAKSIIECYRDKLPRVQFMPGFAPGRRADIAPEPLDGRAQPDGGWSARMELHDALRQPDSHGARSAVRTRRTKRSRSGKSENHAYEGVGRFFEARPFSPEEVVDPYADLDPLSRAHHQAQDKKIAGEKFGDIPQLHVRV